MSDKAMVHQWASPELYEDVPVRKALERQNELALRIFVTQERPDVSETLLDSRIRRDWKLLTSVLPEGAESWSPPVWLLQTWVEI
jgi:hypothetical protein